MKYGSMMQLESEVCASSSGTRAGVTVKPSASPRAEGKRWGVILAGGDGTRLSSLTRFICGDERPKQFCAMFDGATLLEHTLRRAEQVIEPERLLVSLTEHHHKWYTQEARVRPSQRVVQPLNKGTAPPIAHSLLSIADRDKNGLVAILPSDHHYSNEPLFLAALESAFELAEQRPEAVILLGAEPDCPEVEYGWIELGSPVEQRRELFHVRAFQEKPPLEVARTLLAQGAVWNTFVMVGRVGAFLRTIQAALPDLTEMLSSAPLWRGEELRLGRNLYDRLSSVNLSHSVLAVQPEQLLTLRLGPVGWSDLGDPDRAAAAALEDRAKPRWAVEWRGANAVAKPAASVSQPPLSRLASA